MSFTHRICGVLAAFPLAMVLAVMPVGSAKAETPGGQSYGLAFASFAPLNTDIYIADADGSHARPILPNPALDYDASFSSDGRWIAFTSTRNGSSDIYRVRRDGTRLQQLTHGKGFDDQGVLSPDGKSLAFVSTRSGQADIWILDLATGALRNLTDHAGGDFRPAWSPDGQWIAFSSDRQSKKPTFTFVTLQSTEIFVVRIDGTELRQLTHDDAFAGSPAWSPDGKQLVFYETGIDDVQKITSPRRLHGTTEIVTLDLASARRETLTSGSGEKWSPGWLSDGRIAYVSGGPEGGVEFVADAPGARGEMRNPHWSADGKAMLFQREVGFTWPPHQTWSSLDPQFKLVRTGIFPSFSPTDGRLIQNDQTAGALHNSILMRNGDGKNGIVLFTDAQHSALAPVWSPQGDQIAFGLGGFFQSVTGQAIADIAIVQKDGKNLRLLTAGTGNFGFPSWSPDQSRLVYRAAGKNQNGLFIVDVTTHAVTVLTSGAGHENFPSWSPLGDRIAYTSDQDGDYEIYTIRPDGTEVKRLTSSPGNDAHNTWSPDGQWIAFTSARGGFKDEVVLHPYNPQPYGDLYVMRADGTDVRQLTDNQFEEGTPSWLPLPAKAGH